MTERVTQLGSLAAAYDEGSLFRDWLGGAASEVKPSARQELDRTYGERTWPQVAPLWQSPAFAGFLSQGTAVPDVVVTGQQPGFLGGPMLTLYKVATAVALAEQRTAAGRPTVPVFWSGDDDDDLAEALAPVGWDDQNSALWRSPALPLRGGKEQRRLLGNLGPDFWAAPVLRRWPHPGGDDDLTRRLRAVLTAAVKDEQTWGPGQAALMATVFGPERLVVVRGNDPELHRAAAPFYAEMSGRMPELSRLARDRGEELKAAGFHAQINERSLSRALFQLSGGERVAVPGGAECDAGSLRPGVMLRSLVQDWLLQPVAVVVGPGEFAYLKQLEPLYRAMALYRAPLVPRLSGWLLPAGAAGEDAAALVKTLGGAGASADVEALADRISEATRREVATVLRQELLVDSRRADELAQGRARRFRKGVVTMLKGEIQRTRSNRLAQFPAWLVPEGKRQERSLGLLSALAHWRGPLLADVMSAAREHLNAGRGGAWSEWSIHVGP